MAKVIKLSNKYSADMTREEADAEVARLVAKGREILAAKATAPATAHRADVHGHGFQFYWACSCGKSGKPTTDGRASAGRDRHLTAERRKAR